MAWFVLGGFVANRLGFAEPFYYLSLPLFFFAFFKSVSPFLQRAAPYFHTVLWAMLGPFLFGAVLAILWHSAAYLLGFHA